MAPNASAAWGFPFGLKVFRATLAGWQEIRKCFQQYLLPGQRHLSVSCCGGVHGGLLDNFKTVTSGR